MIVLTTVIDTPKHLMPGDKFCLRVRDEMGYEVMVEEEVTVHKVIDFIASYRFALDDGTCPGFHLSGIFGCKSELPKEIREAVHIEDLTPEQYTRFCASVGIKRHDGEPMRMLNKALNQLRGMKP